MLSTKVIRKGQAGTANLTKKTNKQRRNERLRYLLVDHQPLSDLLCPPHSYGRGDVLSIAARNGFYAMSYGKYDVWVSVYSPDPKGA